jgi:hypothetical protein
MTEPEPSDNPFSNFQPDPVEPLPTDAAKPSDSGAWTCSGTLLAAWSKGGWNWASKD